jgi:hypothetical protein
MMIESNDYEWLLARERGEDVSHIPAHTRDKYTRLDQLIQDLPASAPSPGWKQRVLDSLDDSLVADRPRNFPLATARSRVASPRRSPPLPPRRLPWALGSGILSLAAVLTFCVWRGDHASIVRVSEPRAHPAVVAVVDQREAHDARGTLAMVDDRAIEYLKSAADASPTAPFGSTPLVGVRRGPGIRRGDALGLHIGDTLVIETFAERPVELRVYGDAGEPLGRCTEARGCRVARIGAGWKYHLELELRGLGRVQTVEFSGSAMPVPFVDLDKDLEAAGKAGVAMRDISVVHVE